MFTTISIVISGTVQGVFYRQSTKEMAKALELTGLVKNLPDGSVYIIASGSKVKLDMLVAWCRKGPPKARVTGIKVEEIALQQFDQFSVERS
jgi:acylphosphatase